MEIINANKTYTQNVDNVWIVFPLIFDKVFYMAVDSVYNFRFSLKLSSLNVKTFLGKS